MTTLATLRRIDPRAVITCVLIASICAIFWLNPGYSGVQSKAGADPDDALSTPLGFESHFAEPRADEKIKRIGWTAARWAVTNKQGIAVGVLLAAGLRTLVPLLPRSRAFLSTFNAIALGFLFTLFPLFLVGIKLVADAAMALVVAPRLSRRADRPESPNSTRNSVSVPVAPIVRWARSAFATMSDAAATTAGDAPNGWLHALRWVVLRYSKNLVAVLLVSLPLAIVAALIGATLVETLPWTRVAQIAQVEGWMRNAGLLLLVAMIGTLLPVPIVVNVIACAVLWDAGVPMYVVAALLVTLGSSRVHARSASRTTFAWRTAALAGAAVLALGIVAGATAGIVDRWHDWRAIGKAASMLEELPAPKPHQTIVPAGRPGAELSALAPTLPAAKRVVAVNGLELWGAPFVHATARAGATPFTRIEGALIGFDRLPLPRPYQLMQMGLLHLGSIAGGDINDDGWPDVAIGTSFGVFVYANVGGRFALQEIDFPSMRDWIISVVALVDLDGDRALDLFVCAWMNGCHILFNRGGSFSIDAHAELPRFEETAVTAVAFADVDRDGLLDIVTGTSTSQPRFFYPAPAVNRLWRNKGAGKFEPEALAGPEGDTLALLFTDLNGDGWPDLFVGNDFDEPDRIYLNERGTLRPVKAAASPIPYSTKTTMSVDAGDLDNDGRNELYVGQIAMGKAGEMDKRLKEPVAGCDIYIDVAERSRCNAAARFQLATITAHNANSLEPCVPLTDPVQRRDCVVMSHHWWRILVRLPALGADKAKVLAECAKIPRDFDTLHDVCGTIARSEIDNDESELVFTDELPSVKHDNLLFAPRDKGFQDVTQHWGAGFGGWTWNAKFADLDNDTWQDLYVAQGSRLRPSGVSAIFYHNENGKTFRDATKSFGLEDHVPTGAYLYLDYDLDGDLDIITRPFQLTPVLMRNDSSKGPGLEIELDDRRSANRYAIGARIEIRAPDGRLQVRDMKASGGYASSDAPLAFFGLGNWPSVAAIKVLWPDGALSALEGLTLAPGRYRLVRLAG